MLFRIALIAFCVFSLVNASEFREKSPFSNVACLKHKERTWTDEGINYRLGARGQIVVRREDKTQPHMNPKTNFETCREMCGSNPDCVAYAFRHRDGLCQLMSHCRLSERFDMNFRYFMKQDYGCRSFTVVEGTDCLGIPMVNVTTGYTRVQDCHEMCSLTDGCNAFSIDENIRCKLYETCEKRVFDPRSISFI